MSVHFVIRLLAGGLVVAVGIYGRSATELIPWAEVLRRLARSEPAARYVRALFDARRPRREVPQDDARTKRLDRASETATGPARFALRATVSGQTICRLPDASVVTVGRSTGNTVRLTDPAVSATHAAFVPDGERVWLLDRGATNRIFVNGREVQGAAVLRPGDVVTVGERARWELVADDRSVPPDWTRRCTVSSAEAETVPESHDGDRTTTWRTLCTPC